MYKKLKATANIENDFNLDELFKFGSNA